MFEYKAIQRSTLLTEEVALFCYKVFVLDALWNWFVAPLGVEPIGLVWAAGLVMLAYTLQTRAFFNPEHH